MDSKNTDNRGMEEVAYQPRLQDQEVDRFSMAASMTTVFNRWQLLAKKYWWIVVLGAILGVGPAYYIVSHQTLQYESKGCMVVAQRTNSRDALVSDERTDFVGTQGEILKSSAVQDATMSSFLQKHEGEEVAVLYTNKITENPFYKMFKFTSTEDKKSQSLTLSVVGDDPKYVQEYLDGVMAEYLKFRQSLRQSAAESTYEQLLAEKASLEKEIDELEDSISNFRATNSVIVLEGAGAGARDELKRVTAELSRCERELNVLKEMTVDQIRDAVASGAAIADGMGETDNGVASSLVKLQTQYYNALQELQKLKADRDVLTEWLKDSHPKVREIDRNIEAQQSVVKAFADLALQTVNSQREGLEHKVAELQKAFNVATEQSTIAEKMLADFRQIEEKIETKKEEYQSVLSRLKTVDFSNMFSAESLSILDKASLGKPLTSVRVKGLGMGLLLGLALGFFVIYFINIFDDTFGTISELTGQVSETILGQIPEIKSAKGESIFSLMVGGDSASHGLVESFRNLRSSIMFANPAGQTPKVIGVTSSVPAEGKSTVASNLAISLAKSGKKVLLMDGDVRRGRIMTLLGLKNVVEPEKEDAAGGHKHRKGLVEFLYQEVSVDDVILKSPVAGLETLDIIPAGKLQKSPGEIFLSPALSVLFNELRQRYDFIIVDTAPMLATDDTSNLAQKVDTCIFVVRGDFTSMRFVRESLKRLRSRCINVLGLVFNRGHVATKDRYYYYYEYDEYYGMGEDGKRVKKRKRRSHY